MIEIMLTEMGGNSHWTLEISNTNTQTVGSTETKIVKISDDLALVNGKLFLSPHTPFQHS